MREETIKDEAELAKITKVFLELKNWKTYPEVVIDLFNGRPDYVCVKNSELCQVVECKKSLTYPLIEQLARWQIDADKRMQWQTEGHEERIAIPHLLCAFIIRKTGAISDLKKLLLKRYRIGVYTVSKRPNLRTLKRTEEPYFCTSGQDHWVLVWGEFEYGIHQVISPKIQYGSRRTAIRIINALNDDMCCTQAGLRGGEADYMTPFKRTMNRVRQVLSDGKERHIQHILNEIQPLGGHHYCTDKVAMASITTYIDKFGIAKRTREQGPWFIVERQS